MSDIFISYASEDKEKAGFLTEVLEGRGWSVWWDRKILPGKSFSQVIKEALDNAKCVVVLWSSKSAESDWVQNEAAEGFQRKILVPVLIEDVQIPFEFRRIQAADLIDWKTDRSHLGVVALVKAISEIIGDPYKSKKYAEAKVSIEAEDEAKSKAERDKHKTEALRGKAEETHRTAEEKAKHKAEKDNRQFIKYSPEVIVGILVVIAVVLISLFGRSFFDSPGKKPSTQTETPEPTATERRHNAGSVKVSAALSEGDEAQPSNINIFRQRADEYGKAKLEKVGSSSYARTEYTFTVPAGEYIVKASHGNANAEKKVEVEEGKSQLLQLNYHAGRVKVSAALSEGG